MLHGCPAPAEGGLDPSRSLSMCVAYHYSLFPQKSLPLLENQIKENHQKITEELQKYGMDIPEDENERMFFLIDVSTANWVQLETDIIVQKGAVCPLHFFLHCPEVDPDPSAPLAPKRGCRA